MKIPGGSNHKFSEAPQANIQRSSFDRSHGYKTTFDGGYLYPIFMDQALPGDTFNLRIDGLCPAGYTYLPNHGQYVLVLFLLRRSLPASLG